MCSRLLLHGSLEELHTLQAAIIEKVAYDLRQEMAVVRLHPSSEIPRPDPNGHAEAMTEVTKRLSALEKHLSALAVSVDRHERVIKRAIKIAGAVFQVEQQ